MKIKIQFGLEFDNIEVGWNQGVPDFPTLVIYKDKKWEFIMYVEDETNQVDFLFQFSEVPTYDPNYVATTYQTIDHLIIKQEDCWCGAHFSSFPWDHMRSCPKWRKW